MGAIMLFSRPLILFANITFLGGLGLLKGFYGSVSYFYKKGRRNYYEVLFA